MPVFRGIYQEIKKSMDLFKVYMRDLGTPLDKFRSFNQCSRFMIIGYGSGSSDLYLLLMVRIRSRILLFSSVTFKMPVKNIFFPSKILKFLCLFLFEGTSHKEVTKQEKSRLSSFFHSRVGSGSGSIQINYGSKWGSWRPKNIRILWMQTRIRNTAFNMQEILRD
jgi:hypothetical protein